MTTARPRNPSASTAALAPHPFPFFGGGCCATGRLGEAPGFAAEGRGFGCAAGALGGGAGGAGDFLGGAGGAGGARTTGAAAGGATECGVRSTWVPPPFTARTASSLG